MAYIAIFSTAWLAVLLADHVRVLRRSLGLALALVALLFAALRGDSVDYDGYVDLYDVMLQFDMPYPARLYLAKDALFSVMLDVIQFFGGGPQLMFVLMALLSVGLKQRAFARVFRGNTTAAWAVTLSLTFFMHDFTQSRTAVAVAMICLALLAQQQGRRTAWFLWIWAGVGFHLSALLFLPLTAVHWLPAQQRTPALLALVLLTCLVLAGSFELLGTVDLRVGAIADTTGASFKSIALAVGKFAVLLLLARSVERHPVSLANQALVRPCLGLVLTGLAMLITLQGVSSVLAFRLYEMFDAFAVFIVAAALMQRRALPVVLALGYCVLGIVLQYLPDLYHMPYIWAPWRRWFG